MNTPTPLRSHFAFCAVLFVPLIIGGPARPAWASEGSGWVETVCTQGGNDYTYYYRVGADGDPILDTRDRGEGRDHVGVTFYSRPVLDPDKVEGFRVDSHLHKVPPKTFFECHVIEPGINDQHAAFADTPVSADSELLTPDGVEPGIWRSVRAMYPELSDKYKNQEFIAQVLTHIKQNNAEQFEPFLDFLENHESFAGYEGAGKLVSHGIGHNWDPAATAAWALEAMKDPDVVVPPGPEVPDPGEGVSIGTDTPKPIREVGNSLGSGEDFEARVGDIANRFMEFIWPMPLPEGSKSFIHSDIREDMTLRGDEGGEGLSGALKQWVSEDENRLAVAWIYYALGPGEEPPAWVLDDPVLKFYLTDESHRGDKLKAFEKLLMCHMDRWTEGKEWPDYCTNLELERGQTHTPLETAINEWLQDYMRDAWKETMAILHARIPADVLRGIIGRADKPPPTPGAPEGPGRQPGELPRASASFGVDHLFGKWGDPNVFFVPSRPPKPDENPLKVPGRFVAIVVRTKRSFDGEPPQAVFKQQIGVYDITNESNIYGKRFDLSSDAQHKFALKGGGLQYVLSFKPKGADTEISFKRANGAMPVNGQGQNAPPTVNGMFRMRAEQALQDAQRTVVDGQTYHVTAESSDKGSLLFWDAATLHMIRENIGNPREWVPSMLADVNHKVNGRVQNIAGEVHLGKVNGKWHKLKWNSSLRIWEPWDCGDAEKGCAAPTPPAKTEGGGAPGGGDPQNTPQTGGPEGGDTPTGSAWPEKLLGVQGNHVGNTRHAQELNAALSADLQSRMHFYEDANAAQGHAVYLALERTPGTQKVTPLPYLRPRAEGDPFTIFGETVENGRYLVTLTNIGSKYTDLSRYTTFPPPDATVGEYYLKGDPAFANVTDREVLRVLMTLAGYKGTEQEKTSPVGIALTNLDAQLRKHGVSDFRAYGNRWNEEAEQGKKGLVVGTFGGRHQDTLFPGLAEGHGDLPPGSAEETKPGVWMRRLEDSQAREGLSVFDQQAGFPPATPTRSDGYGTPAARDLVNPGQAALYKLVEESTTTWYLMITVEADNLQPKRVRAAFPVFQDRTDRDNAIRIAKPEGLTKDQIGGLRLVQMPDTAQIEIKPRGHGGHDYKEGTEGYIAAYKGTECVGVVAWWGMQKQEACTSCGAAWWSDNTCREVAQPEPAE